MKKYIAILFIALSFVLVGCNRNDTKEPTASDKLETALLVFEDKNYEMSVDIFYYNELQQSLKLKVDGNKSYLYFNEDNEVYYERDGNTLTTYTKDADRFVKSEESSELDNSLLMFNNLDVTWFSFNNNVYSLIKDNTSNLVELLNLSEEFSVDSATLILNEDDSEVAIFTIKLDHGGWKYSYEFKVSNYGTTVITIPTGGNVQ